MRIKEVEQRTGLTAKAIRLYESKGLLKPARETENDYRDYTEEDVARLKTIAILRKLDLSVAEIKEWTDGQSGLADLLHRVSARGMLETEKAGGKEDGKVVGYKLIGGGFGHGVGMSQNGAKNMAAAGYKAEDILQFYYEGCDVRHIYTE